VLTLHNNVPVVVRVGTHAHRARHVTSPHRPSHLSKPGPRPQVLMPHNNAPVVVRVGLHTGPATSGLVGSKLPKFSWVATF
jgi:class 3 adenylate cyclase